MIKSIAIYPQEINAEYERKVKTTISLASEHGFNEVFTSLHLPEILLDTQIKAFELIARTAKDSNLEVTVDVGGHYFDDILNSHERLNILKNASFDFIRIDYGSDITKTKMLYSSIAFRGVVINASIYSEQEIDREIAELKSIDEKIEIRACHNYYPQNNTGLDEAFARSQDAYFRKNNILVYYCIPSYLNPRGPLFEGLCTLEKHRYQSISEVLSDLYINSELSAFIMADEWLSEDEFKEVEHTLQILEEPLGEVVTVQTELLPSCSKSEQEIVLKKHRFRFDSSFNCLRSQSSREMAEFASPIVENNTVDIEPGTITIDNKLFKRYSGELKVIFNRQKNDGKINVIGTVKNKDDIIRLRRFREGHLYQFVEVK